MEKRIITIVDSASQGKYVIEIDATVITLGDLKQALKANENTKHLNFDDTVTFNEGFTKTEMVKNEAILPDNVPYKGTIKRDLVFMVTKTNKKITSGGMTRSEIYSKINSNQTLKASIKKKHGNYTQVSSTILEKEINDYYNQSIPAIQVEVKPVGLSIQDEIDQLKQDLVKLKATIVELQSEFNKSIAVPTVVAKPVIESPYSDEEIEDLFN